MNYAGTHSRGSVPALWRCRVAGHSAASLKERMGESGSRRRKSGTEWSPTIRALGTHGFQSEGIGLSSIDGNGDRSTAGAFGKR